MRPADFLRDRVRLVQVAPAILVLIWRVATVAPAALWRDWIAILSLHWAFTVYAAKSKAWPPVTVAVMAFLLGIYASAQVSLARGWLGMAP